VSLEDGRVKVEFKAAGETRLYAVNQAPLKRLRFRVGDKIRTQAEKEFTIREAVEKQGLLIYLSKGQELPEAQVNDRVSLQDRRSAFSPAVLMPRRFLPCGAFPLRAAVHGERRNGKGWAARWRLTNH